jgi:hypothetical protein
VYESIIFPPEEPQWEFTRDGLSFPALVDGKSVKCLITLELLLDRFGALKISEAEAVKAFRENRPSILALARSQIRLGRISPDNELLLTTDTTSLRRVTYQDRLKEWGAGLSAARQATRCLEEVLGRHAEEVSAEWDRSEDARGRSMIALQLSDFAGSVTAIYQPEELASSPQMRERLYRRFYSLWGDLLQIRSHKLLDNLMSDGEGE